MVCSGAAHRRRGIGSHVLAGILDEAQRAQRPVILRVLRSNPRARAFYNRHGFTVTEETETHYYMERTQAGHELRTREQHGRI